MTRETIAKIVKASGVSTGELILIHIIYFYIYQIRLDIPMRA